LWVGIEQNDLLAAHCQLTGDVGGERCFADAAFLVQQSDDHGAALLAGKPVFLLCEPCRLAVFHRNGALYLLVKEFKLGKLERPETRALIGFPAVPHA
jgi:hypothetical protein